MKRLRATLFCGVLFALTLWATYPVTSADIVGAGAAAAPISATPASARQIQFAVTGSGTVRLGDSTVTASKGIPVVAGGADFWPPLGNERYELERIYYYVPSGATLSINIWR